MNELTSDKDKVRIGPGSGKGLVQLCCLCGKPLLDHGHNPDTSPDRLNKPLGKDRCCDRCNYEIVVPARHGLRPGALGTLEQWQATFKEGMP
jgi:hypothetical protein